MKLSLIVPCYNEEGNILPLYDKVKETFRDHISDYEFVFVNDGSYDRTPEVLKALVEQADVPITVVNFSRNFGKESAILAGLHHASGDYLSLIDGDLQQNPSFVLNMVQYLDEHSDCDCVCAYQENRKESPAMIFLKDEFYKVINSISDTTFVSGASDFRTFRRNVAEAVMNLSEVHRFSKGMFSWVGFNTYYMPYTVEERLSGTSKWNVFKLFRYAFDGIIAFTTKPLKLATLLGAGITGFSGLYAVAKLLFQKETKSEEKLTALLLCLSGLQIFTVGIASEYLARTYDQAINRPVYIAKSVLTNRPKKDD